MRYEGVERIATDSLHRRFPATPRVTGNDTVTWQQRPFSVPFQFDNFDRNIPSEEDVFMRFHFIEVLQPTEDEGIQAIGKSLMDML